MSKIDLRTRLYLNFTGAEVVEHIKVENKTEKIDLMPSIVNKREVYIFNSYKEYKEFFLMYLDKVNEDIIKCAIYTRGKDGQVVVHKGICEHIINKEKNRNDLLSKKDQKTVFNNICEQLLKNRKEREEQGPRLYKKM